jgi:hypothetical protein
VNGTTYKGLPLDAFSFLPRQTHDLGRAKAASSERTPTGVQAFSSNPDEQQTSLFPEDEEAMLFFEDGQSSQRRE